MLHSSHSGSEARNKSTSAFACQVKLSLHCTCLVLNYGNLTVVAFFQSLLEQQHLRTRGCAKLWKRHTTKKKKKRNSITQRPSVLRWESWERWSHGSDSHWLVSTSAPSALVTRIVSLWRQSGQAWCIQLGGLAVLSEIDTAHSKWIRNLYLIKASPWTPSCFHWLDWHNADSQDDFQFDM